MLHSAANFGKLRLFVLTEFVKESSMVFFRSVFVVCDVCLELDSWQRRTFNKEWHCKLMVAFCALGI